MDGATVVSIIAAIAAILNIMATIVGGVLFLARMNARLDVQNVQITALQETTAYVSKTVTAAALADQRLQTHAEMIATLQKQVEDLRDGRGYILAQKEHA